jgi:hypothetical protein
MRRRFVIGDLVTWRSVTTKEVYKVCRIEKSGMIEIKDMLARPVNFYGWVNFYWFSYTSYTMSKKEIRLATEKEIANRIARELTQ